MGFFDRNRKALIERGIDPARLPPGQYSTDRFPVLHVGKVPTYDLTTWTFRVLGSVGHPVTWSWDELRALPATAVTTDIHCVTKWSKFDTHWKGVRIRDLLELAAGPNPDATHVVIHADYGYTTNVPLPDVLGDNALIAYEYDGGPIPADHGYPARALIPQLYFWKSAKWVRAMELVTTDQPGFWEVNGYHNVGDPWREQRFTND